MIGNKTNKKQSCKRRRFSYFKFSHLIPVMFDIVGIAKCNEQSKVQISKSNLHLCNILYFEIGQSISAIADWHNTSKNLKKL